MWKHILYLGRMLFNDLRDFSPPHMSISTISTAYSCLFDIKTSSNILKCCLKQGVHCTVYRYCITYEQEDLIEKHFNQFRIGLFYI